MGDWPSCAHHGETVTCALVGGSVRRYTHAGFICTQARSLFCVKRVRSPRNFAGKAYRHSILGLSKSRVPSRVPSDSDLRVDARESNFRVLTRLALSRHHIDGHNSELTARGAGRDAIGSRAQCLSLGSRRLSRRIHTKGFPFVSSFVFVDRSRCSPSVRPSGR